MVLAAALALAGLPRTAMAATLLDIDTGNSRACVLVDGRQQECYEDIAIGRFGASADRLRGDGTTPLGDYRVAWIKPDARFGYFIGIDYPGVAEARRAAKAGVISASQLQAIESAHRRHELPPQDTALGGFLGIHGIGEGDLWTHQNFNWTRGCVALDNEQLDNLLKWLRIGTRVRIH